MIGQSSRVIAQLKFKAAFVVKIFTRSMTKCFIACKSLKSFLIALNCVLKHANNLSVFMLMSSMC